MKREIKFRIWDNTLKQMEAPFTLNDDFDCMQGWLDGCQLMQYTGLKDKNGKEIYEGDIIRLPIGELGNVIYFEPYAAFVGDSDGILTQLDLGADIEVIGNIYENPELLQP